MGIQKSDRMQSKFKKGQATKFEMGQAVSMHVDAAFIIHNHAFTDNTLHSMLHLIGKKLHPLLALLLLLEKLKAL